MIADNRAARASARARAGCAPSGVQIARTSSSRLCASARFSVAASSSAQREERQRALVGGGAGVREGRAMRPDGLARRRTARRRYRVHRAGDGRRAGRAVDAARLRVALPVLQIHMLLRCRPPRGDTLAQSACPSDWPSTAPLHSSQRSCALSHSSAVGRSPMSRARTVANRCNPSRSKKSMFSSRGQRTIREQVSNMGPQDFWFALCASERAEQLPSPTRAGR